MVPTFGNKMLKSIANFQTLVGHMSKYRNTMTTTCILYTELENLW